jgi:long-chain-fatty-acid--CoA ligase ACSBG
MSQPEWFIANTGSVLAGCISAGIYTTNSPEACFYVSDHSKAEIVVVEGNKQLAKYAAIAKDLKYVKVIVVWDEVADPKLVSKLSNVHVLSWDAFLKVGSEVPDAEVDARSLHVTPGNCASLIYTSGTTGPPKAVMISHDNITWTSSNVCQHYMDLNHLDVIISYLPLSHIAAQMIDIYCLMKLGGCTYFAQPDALKGSLTKTLKDVQPTFFFGVPRVWEKIQEKMVQLGRDGGTLKQALGRWAKSVGTQHSAMVQFGASGGQPWGYGCANALVFSKIKQALGLARTKGCLFMHFKIFE